MRKTFGVSLVALMVVVALIASSGLALARIGGDGAGDRMGKLGDFWNRSSEAGTSPNTARTGNMPCHCPSTMEHNHGSTGGNVELIHP